METIKKEIRSIDELIYEYYKKNPDGHYFDHDTLKWFGERRSDMRLLKGISVVTDVRGEKHEVYCISRLQRKYPGGARRSHAYFDTTTLDVICR